MILAILAGVGLGVIIALFAICIIELISFAHNRFQQKKSTL